MASLWNSSQEDQVEPRVRAGFSEHSWLIDLACPVNLASFRFTQTINSSTRRYSLNTSLLSDARSMQIAPRVAAFRVKSFIKESRDTSDQRGSCMPGPGMMEI